MFSYLDENGVEVVVIRETCHCIKDRKHVFTVRLNRFCYLWRRVNWYKGLLSVACLTIFFGILKFLIVFFVTLNGKPSAIDIIVLFPIFSIMTLLELITFVSLGMILWYGVRTGILKLVKFFSWGLLLGYLFAIFLIISVIMQGELLVRAIVWHQNGMTLKNYPDKESGILLIYKIIFYVTLLTLGFLCILFTTYMVILTLSFIEQLESEIRGTNV